MEPLIAQNNLLKKYNHTLQQQNSTRNQQAIVLSQQLHNISKQLETIKHKHTLQLNQIQQQNQNKINMLNDTINQLTSNHVTSNHVTSKPINYQSQHTQSIQTYLTNQLTLMENKYSQQIANYQKTINNIKQQIETYKTKINALEQNNKNQIYKFSIREIQYKNQIKVLNDNNSMLKGQLRELSQEIMEKSTRINQLQRQQQAEETFKKHLVLKDNEIKHLQKTNHHLKIELYQIQSILKKKDENILSMENIIQQLKHHQQQELDHCKIIIQNQKKQNQSLKDYNYLRKSGNNIQQYNKLIQQQKNNINNYIQFNKMLQLENNKLKEQSAHFKALIANLRKQNITLKQSFDFQFKYIKQALISNNVRKQSQFQQLDSKKQVSLINLVTDLKQQLVQIKKSNEKIQIQNLKLKVMMQKHIKQNQSNFCLINSDTQSHKKQLNFKQQLKISNNFIESDRIDNYKRQKIQNHYQNQHNQISKKDNAYLTFNPAQLKKKRLSHKDIQTIKPYQFLRKSTKSIDKQIIKNDQWEHVQKKINYLRQQNQQLKKTLFD